MTPDMRFADGHANRHVVSMVPNHALEPTAASGLRRLAVPSAGAQRER